MRTIYGSGGGVAVGQQVSVDILGTPIDKVGTWQAAQNSAAWYSAVVYNGSNAQGDYMTFGAFVTAGEYQMDLFATKDSYCGIVTIKVDGISVTTTDLHAASATPTRISFGITVPVSGRQITLAMDTTSGGGHIGQLSRLILTRTA